MGTFLEITTTNYNGQLANITFFPCSGGSINLGQVTLPYYYDNPNYYGSYQIYIINYKETCNLVIPCPTPTPTKTPTPTPTPKIKNLAYNVLSCCGKLSGIIILPSTFTIGTTILTTGNLCMTITGFASKGAIPTVTWAGISYKKGCEECLSDYPCNPLPTPTPTPTKCKGCQCYILDGGSGHGGYTEFSYIRCGEQIPITVTLYRTDTPPTNTLLIYAECNSVVKISGTGTYTVTNCSPTPTPTTTPTSTPTSTPTNYCLIISNESGCGTYTIPNQGEGLINGKKYWTGIINGNPFIMYWDNVNICWVVKNTDTDEECSKLYIDSAYPQGDYTQWVSVTATPGCECLATDTYFTVRLIDCPTPTPTPTNTVTPTQTPSHTPTQTPTNTSTPTTTPTTTPTPSVTSSPLPPIIGYLQDCCNSSVVFKVGSLAQALTIGESYYVETEGYKGCATAINETSVLVQFSTTTVLIDEGNCDSCNVKHSIVCSTPTPTPTPTVTQTPTQTPTQTQTPTLTPTSTQTPTPTPTPTTSSEVCINCNITGYTYMISDPVIYPSPRPTRTPTPTPTTTPDNTVYTIWVHIE